jgi:hypothetical protein
MMNLYEKITQIYPELKADALAFSTFIILQDDKDGNGSYIAKWEHPTLAKPTDEQLKGL